MFLQAELCTIPSGTRVVPEQIKTKKQKSCPLKVHKSINFQKTALLNSISVIKAAYLNTHQKDWKEEY